MVVKEILVALVHLTLMDRSLALSCIGCRTHHSNGTITEYDCGPPPTCSFGLTINRVCCECCDVCAKGPGEMCGRHWGCSGTCAEGLQCEEDPEADYFDTGICVGDLITPAAQVLPLSTTKKSVTCASSNSKTCKDRNRKCAKWAAKGKCSNGKIFSKCKSSCVCGIDSNPPCKDTMRKCPKLAARGKCRRAKIYKKCKCSCACVVKCPLPWFRVGNECFLRVEPDFEYLDWSWSSARSYCREQAPRADLAQPNNIKGLADYLVDNGYDRRYQHYWIGGSDIVTEGEWLWLNGSVVTNTTHYRGFERTEWNNGDGGADCLTIWIGEGSDSVDLYDWECDEGFIFICERY